MQERKENIQESRYIRVGIIGPIGSGKSTLSRLLAEHWNANLIEEPFSENKYLEDFYKHPEAFAYMLDISFAELKFRKLKDEGEKIKENVQIVDPDMLMERIYKSARKKMGWYVLRDSIVYDGLFDLLESSQEVPTDAIISVNAPFDTLVERIKQRGRPFEKWMLEGYPEYLNILSEEVNIWLKEKIDVPIIEIDSGELNFVDNEKHKIIALKEVDDFVAYYLERQKGLMGVDGKKLILPKNIYSLRSHIRDVVPGKDPQSKKFV